jgi:LysM repeat protein
MKLLPIRFSTTAVGGMLFAALAALISPSCNNATSNTGTHPGYGPFDSRGNYVEELADSPSRWGRAAKSPPPVPQNEQALLAGNDNPPANLTPLSSGGSSRKPSSGSADLAVAGPPPVVKRSSETVKSTTTKPKPADAPVRTVSKSKPEPAVVKTTPKTKSKPEPAVVKTTSKPKTKSKTVASKPRPSSSTRVVVKKGDTLYALALRHNTSVSAIQKANGIKGSNLTVGKSLTIPRK